MAYYISALHSKTQCTAVCTLKKTRYTPQLVIVFHGVPSMLCSEVPVVLEVQ